MDLNFHEVRSLDIEVAEGFDLAAHVAKTYQLYLRCTHSIDKRLFGSSELEPNTSEYEEVLNTVSCDSKNVRVRKILSKHAKAYYEVSYLEDCSFVCVPVILVEGEDRERICRRHIYYPFKLSFSVLANQSVRVTIFSGIEKIRSNFLATSVLPTLLRWFAKAPLNGKTRETNRLISREKYNETYRRIKLLRGKSFVENWPESTDPRKHVHEDCGIVTYLLETWDRQGSRPKFFVDIGCGNGLLVYLLNAEGVDGFGIDVQRRKIWDSLLCETKLVQGAVDPMSMDNVIPPTVDFIIGNHCDELSPWLPILAARRRCGFFLLPCCPFDLKGKFSQRKATEGLYEGFLNYLRQLCLNLGFIVEEDYLSIPSTKRYAFIGSVPASGLPVDIEDRISKIVGPNVNFAPRVPVPNKNCTDIPHDVIDTFLRRIYNHLLSLDNKVVSGWRVGGETHLSELMSLFSEHEKEYLKSQNGGIQTLLKNHRALFKVSCGNASIRDPRTDPPAKPSKKPIKNAKKKNAEPRPCRVAALHPMGCPMGESCPNLH